MAVWSPSADLYTTAFTLTVLVCGTLLSPIFCAPASVDPWWYSSCDSTVIRIRHSRSATDPHTHITNQLNKFMHHINTTIRDINRLYGHPIRRGIGKIHWLKFKKLLRSMKNNATRIQEFYKILQIFAGSLDALMNAKIDTKIPFDREARDKIYAAMIFETKLLLCELYDYMAQNNMAIPAGIPNKHVQRKIKTLDFTAAYMHDYNFFKKMKSFFATIQKAYYRLPKQANVKKNARKNKVGVPVKRKRT